MKTDRVILIIVLAMAATIAPRAQSQAPVTINTTVLRQKLGISPAQLQTLRQVSGGGSQVVAAKATQVTLAPGTFLAAKVGNTALTPVTPRPEGPSPAPAVRRHSQLP